MSQNSLTIHREEYLYLADLSNKSVIIAWGAFYFKVKGQLDNGEWELIDDDDLENLGLARKNLIGASSTPYAAAGTAAEVELMEVATGNVRKEHFVNSNHALLQELKPDTEYRYKVTINGVEWAAGQLRDWNFFKKDNRLQGEMFPSQQKYNNTFRTYPDAKADIKKLKFVVLGDFGRGVRKPSQGGMCQREVAAGLAAIFNDDIRFIITTGDNIYHGSGQGSGNEDDDWFFTFFQPYRYLINRVPVYPSVGNHDEGETLFESTDDRRQLYDNLFIKNRFINSIQIGDASLEPGLFYRFNFGRNIELVCLDTSKQSWLFSERYFKHPNHKQFIESTFPVIAGQQHKWIIPFFHHPPYCAGPEHLNKQSVIDHLVPKFQRAGVRSVFCGHEHNFQHSLVDGISYFVTGGSGQYRDEAPKEAEFQNAGTQAWGGNEEGHFTMVEINGEEMRVTPMKFDKKSAQPLSVTVLRGQSPVPPFIVKLSVDE